MKKFVSLVIITVMLFVLISCGGGSSTGVVNPKIFYVDDYVVEYNGYNLVTDDDGNDAIAVEYKFTNNSDTTAQFIWSVLATYEQNSELLDIAFVTVDEDNLEYLDDSSMQEVEPGESATVCVTYVLSDKTSPVTVTFISEDFENTESFEIELAKTGASGTGFSESENETTDVPQEGLLAGTKWYGWWIITDTTGYYEDYDGEYFDCCAVFEKTNEGYILMSIWDETYPDYEDECLGEVYFEEIDGMLVSVEGGFFYTGESLEEGQMIIDPASSEYEHTLFTYANIEDEDGSFVASINLAEWGYAWDEGFNDFPTYYDSYFLPLMEEGEALPMNLDDIG